MVGRDFNEALWNFENEGGVGKDSKHMADFRECLNSCDLLDLGYSGKIYTWSNRRSNNSQIFKSLDRFTDNSDFIDLVTKHSVWHLDWSCSYHRAIELNFSFCSNPIMRRRHHKNFRFKEIWSNHSDCEQIILNSTDWGSSIVPLMTKLKRFSSNLISWGKRVNNNLKLNIESCRRKLNDRYVSHPLPSFL